MEWSKDKSLKLIELLQVNASLWNPSLSDTLRDKQKRRVQLRSIAKILGIPLAEIMRKIQHLRTQYHREWVREGHADIDDPNKYVSNWYAYEYLHFLQSTNKPFKVLESMESPEMSLSSNSDSGIDECKLANLPAPYKVARLDLANLNKPDNEIFRSRDEFSIFGEYIANELRSLKGEKNLLVAKKKIQDVIFEVKIGIINESNVKLSTVFVRTSQPHNVTSESLNPRHNMTSENLSPPHNMISENLSPPHNMTSESSNPPHNMTSENLSPPHNMTSESSTPPHNMTPESLSPPHSMTSESSSPPLNMSSESSRPPFKMSSESLSPSHSTTSESL